MAALLSLMVAIAPASAAEVYNWTGLYIGGHAGLGRTSDWNSSANPLPDEPAIGVQTTSFDQRGSGFFGGGQIGFNWQFAPAWVAGIEADFSFTGLNGSEKIAPVPLYPGPGLWAPGSQVMRRDMDWFGTVRGRVGYAWDRSLLYVTGGFAYGRVNYEADQFGIFGPARVDLSTTNLGWTIGGGFEYALSGDFSRWSVKAEYLYFALNETATSSIPLLVRFDWNQTAGHIVRIGLNYRLGELGL